jgi:hypothetical protein
VRAYGSVQVTAYGSVQVTAYGSAQVTATKWVVVTVYGSRSRAVGGTVVAVPEITSVEDWLVFWGIETEGEGDKRVAWVFKGVGDNWKSRHGTSYKPWSTPVANDWDGKDRCGGGLHFSPHAAMTLSYDPAATKFLRCPVKISEMVVVTDISPAEKVKAKRVVAPGCQEVTIDGEVSP